MIVILTALQREYQAVQQHLTGLRTRRHAAGTLFEEGVLAAAPDRHVALAVTGEGNTQAATIAERAITEFDPAAVLFVGIAGRLQPWLQIGDVVVATRVYAYQGGRSEDEAFRARPRAWEISHELDQVARHVDRTNKWRSGISGDPGVRFGPIAAGEVLLDSTNSVVAKQLRDHYNDAIAIEMESAGVAAASHLNLSRPAMTVRGISDHADGTKNLTDWSDAPQLAAVNAAAFAAACVAELDETWTEAGRRTEPGTVISNVTTGNSNTVLQIGVVKGSAHFGQAKP